jgi:hypothetical protein
VEKRKGPNSDKLSHPKADLMYLAGSLVRVTSIRSL